MTGKCTVCGKDMTFPPSTTRKFCSRGCFYKSGISSLAAQKMNAEKKLRPQTEKERNARIENMKRLAKSGLGRHFGADNVWFGKRPPMVKSGPEHYGWKGGRKRTKAGYIYAKCDGHHRATKSGYVLEHVMIMEEYLGRPMDQCECVHHCNEKRDDNRIENLELMLKSEHTSYHTKKTNKQIPITCIICGKPKMTTMTERKKGRKYCSRECYLQDIHAKSLLRSSA